MLMGMLSNVNLDSLSRIPPRHLYPCNTEPYPEDDTDNSEAMGPHAECLWRGQRGDLV